jgi:hypothetical protein
VESIHVQAQGATADKQVTAVNQIKEHSRHEGAGRKGTVLVLVLLSALLPPVQSYGSPVDSYVRKYRHVDLSSGQVRSIDDYDRLIVYFSSMSYFRQGFRVNPDFIRALMLAESGGNPNAVSPKNAIGLCQILYPTGKAAAAEILAMGVRFHHVSTERLRNLQPDDLRDPAINILITCYLIAKYNALYNGRLDLVVAAWNAGQGAIVDSRPPNYPETLNLIGRVNGYLLAFHDVRRARLLTSRSR